MAKPRKDLSAAYNTLDEETQGGIRELARQTLENALTATKDQLVKGYLITCPDCGKKKLYDIPVKVPDVLTQLKVWEMLADQLEGKPAETQKVEVNVVARTLGQLEGLSNAELAELAGAEEAEWAELPPAA